MSTEPPALEDAVLQRLLDDQRHAEAVQARRREQSLRHQAAESGTVLGVLTDLAERRQLVSLAITGGRTVRGAIARIGADVVALRGPADETVLVSLGAVAAVRTEPGTVRTVGDRRIHSSATLVDLLGEVAVDRPQVVLHAGTAAVAGELRAVGVDVATVVQADHAVAYVALAAVTEAVIP